MTESQFKKKFLAQMEQEFGLSLWGFTKEALALRGIPDWCGCLNGFPVFLEFKKSKQEANKKKGRIVLQKVLLDKAQAAGAYATLVYPSNAESVLDDLRALFRSRKRVSKILAQQARYDQPQQEAQKLRRHLRGLRPQPKNR